MELFVEIGIHGSVERDFVSAGVFEDSPPTDVGDFGLFLHDGCAEGFGFFQISLDILAVDVDEYFSSPGTLADGAETSARAFVRIPRGVIHFWEFLGMPAEEPLIELGRFFAITGWDFDVDDISLGHFLSLLHIKRIKSI
jgi:hypothetical protein